MAHNKDNCKRQECDAKHKGDTLPTVSYSRQGPGGAVHFEVAASPMALPSSAACAAGRAPITKHRAHAWKLLAAIKRAPRRHGRLGRDRIAGQLRIGAAVYAALADLEERPRDAGEMRRWARGIEGATPAQIESAISVACRPMFSTWPTNRDIGNALRITEIEWCSVYGCARLILPYDIDCNEEIERIARDIAKQKAQLRNEKSRRKRGMKDRRTSVTAIARRLGIHRKTAAAWIKAGKLDPLTGELLARFDTSPTIIIRNRKRIESGTSEGSRHRSRQVGKDSSTKTDDASAKPADSTPGLALEPAQPRCQAFSRTMQPRSLQRRDGATPPKPN